MLRPFSVRLLLAHRLLLAITMLLALTTIGCPGMLVDKQDGSSPSADVLARDPRLIDPSVADGEPALAVDGPLTVDGSMPPIDGPMSADGYQPDEGSGTPPSSSSFPVNEGQATYYNADGSGNCSFDPSPDDLMVAAMNQIDYQDSEACGGCVEVVGPKATIVVRIVDRCPECGKGHIDLSQQAFASIAELAQGVVPISWRYVACEVQGPIIYKFKEGSNQWWTAVQLRNTRYAVKKVEAKTDSGGYVTLTREAYNYFVAASGLGPGPYSFRVTDVLGHVLEDGAIPFSEGGEAPGAEQFPR